MHQIHIPDRIQGLTKEFKKMDTDGSGEISLATLKSVLLGNAAQGSLGVLIEEEVKDIFNAMLVCKSETNIHWHAHVTVSGATDGSLATFALPQNSGET